MVARFHYDDEVLNQFLRDGLDKGGSQVASHVEQCETCQEKLETLSRSEFSWDEVAEFLKPIEEVSSPETAFGDTFSSYELPRFLSHSTHANSLGRFGRYEIMELLGRGGMGIVMRGFDPALNRYSAIKVLTPELASSAAARKRFSREARSAAAVVHPHVVPIQTVDEDNGMPYLVMPVVEGQSVDDRVRKTGPLETIEVVRIASQVAEGLAAAHDQGLVHRDIKPANVLLENGVERVQITDFGLARAVDDASMTRSGVLAGTPQYMSPEQAHGDAIDHRSDLFSLGSLVYFMLTGHSPFRAETTMGVLNRIGNDEPRSLKSINPDVPSWLESVVDRLLAKDPADRFQSADEVADLLGRWLAHLQKPDSTSAPESMPMPSPSTGSPPSRFGGIRRWTAWGVVGGAFVLFGILLVIEKNKATISIESELDNVPIIIKQDGSVYDKLTVNRDGTSIRVFSGSYEIVIGGDRQAFGDRDQATVVRDPTGDWYDRLSIENGNIEIGRGEKTLVRIRSVAASKQIEARDRRHDAWVGNTKAQVKFTEPAGLNVSHSTSNSSGASIVCPGRMNLVLGAVHPFQLSRLPEMEGAELYATIELPEENDITKAYLDHNAIPIGFSKDELEHALAHNLVTKVIYYPGERHSGALSGLQVLVSTRMDPGIDPIVEANRQGTIVAILRIGNRQSQIGVQQSEQEPHVTDSADVSDMPPPSDQNVIRVLETKWKLNDDLTHLIKFSRDKLRIVKEKIADTVGAPRVYPLVGVAQQRMVRWKCTVYFDESIVANWPVRHELSRNNSKVVYLTTSQLLLTGGSAIDNTSGETSIRTSR